MMRTAASLFVTALLLSAGAAWAQTPSTPASSGPLVLERIDSPFVIAPDYKVTDLDGELGQLAGVYGGRLIDNVIFVGGAAYWLTNGSGGDKLTYGGVMVGWSSSPHRWIRFGARGLVGIGTAQLGTEITPMLTQQIPVRFGSRGTSSTGRGPTSIRVRVRDDFFVFEPQANVLTRVTDHVGLDWSVGYRIAGLDDFLDDRLNGATGSVALQLQW